MAELKKSPSKEITKAEKKFEDLLDEELPQVAQIEYILNHDLVKQTREFFKQEISKTMEGHRDANTSEKKENPKIIEKK